MLGCWRRTWSWSGRRLPVDGAARPLSPVFPFIMGCNDSRKGLTQEEIALQDKEILLHLHSKYCDDLLFVFTFHAHNSVISENGLKEAMGKLGIPVSEDFMRVMEGVKLDAGYDLRKLQLMCILLGAPKGNSKPTALFTLYDVSDRLVLSAEVVETMCQDLLSTSITEIGRLTPNTRSQDYLKGLNAVKQEFVVMMLKRIMNSRQEMTKEEFIGAMSEPDTVKYMTAGTLRAAVAAHKRGTSINKYPKNVSSISSLAQLK